MNNYTIDQIRKMLNNNVVEVSFVKKDGTLRHMIATTNTLYLPEVESTDGDAPEPKTTKSRNENIVVCYDIEAQGWRSFRFDSLKGFVITDNPVVNYTLTEVTDNDRVELVA